MDKELTFCCDACYVDFTVTVNENDEDDLKWLNENELRCPVCFSELYCED